MSRLEAKQSDNLEAASEKKASGENRAWAEFR
jgi:hypothetical protein